MNLKHNLRKIILLTIILISLTSVACAPGILGYKYQELGDGSDYLNHALEGWNIYLYNKELPEGVAPSIGGEGYLAHRVTNSDGYFSFWSTSGLSYGNTYYVYEERQSGWTQLTGGIYPADSYYIVTLEDTPENHRFETANFVNWENGEECGDETAWAAQDEPGVNRFVDKGNWGTYVLYNKGDGEENGPMIYPLYAGQTHLAGYLYVYDVKDTLYVRYVSSLMDSDYMGGYTGAWIGMTEYHLQVVDNFADFRANGYTNKKGNPRPGQFDYSEEYDEATDDTGYIKIPIGGYDEEIHIAAHSVMCWSGFPKTL